MSNPYEMFETDAGLETKGVKHTFPGFWFYVARPGGKNEAFKSTLRARSDRAGAANPGVVDDLQEKIVRDTFIEFCMLGWGSDKHGEGIMVARDGSPIPFSKSAVAKLFEELPELALKLITASGNMAVYRKALIEEDAGNSQGS